MWTVAALTVQLPLAAKETCSPEEEVALIGKSASPNVFAASAPNVIVCTFGEATDLHMVVTPAMQGCQLGLSS